MSSIKIDILNDTRQVVAENLETGQRSFYEVDALNEIEASSFISFMQLVEKKTTEPYVHVYVAEYPMKRFVNIDLSSTQLKEIDYANLSSSEASVFDNFFETFRPK